MVRITFKNNTVIFCCNFIGLKNGGTEFPANKGETPNVDLLKHHFIKILIYPQKCNIFSLTATLNYIIIPDVYPGQI